MPSLLRTTRRQGRAPVRWLALAAVLWIAQLGWLYWRLGQPTWSEYWEMRGLYRPGIAAVNAGGSDHLPGYVFNPLSPTGAKWAFILAALVYALAATAVIWLALRLSQRWRRRTTRRVRRALA